MLLVSQTQSSETIAVHKFRRIIATWFLSIALLLAGGLAAVPLAWMVWRSFIVLTPEGAAFSLNHYGELLSGQPSATWFANSLFIAGAQTLIAAAACTLAGYVLAHHRVPYRRVWLGVLMATLLLPSQVALPASWQLMHKLHLLDSYLAMLLPAGANVLGVFLFRHACRQIPPELLDAARIDGCGEFRIWWDVVLPVIQPTLVTFAVLSFTANWNAYLWPQIVLQDARKMTLAMGLANLSALPQYRSDLGLMLAGTALSIIPAFALFLAARHSLESSITEGAVK